VLVWYLDSILVVDFIKEDFVLPGSAPLPSKVIHSEGAVVMLGLEVVMLGLEVVMLGLEEAMNMHMSIIMFQFLDTMEVLEEAD
jgi:hypothetical protein